jgi:hypothetical protein
MPSEQELEGAEFQGKRVAEIAAKLVRLISLTVSGH